MPLSQDYANHQQNLLDINRRNLAHYLNQRATLSTQYVPPGVTSGIREARANIFRIKSILRDAGYRADDAPDDVEAQVVAPPVQQSSGALVRMTIDVRAEDMAAVSKFAVRIHQVESI